MKMFYKIEYIYKGRKGTAVVVPVAGYESKFYEYCIDRIDSLTRAGARIIETTMHHTK